MISFLYHCTFITIETDTSDSITPDSESEAEELEEVYDEDGEGVESNEIASTIKNGDSQSLRPGPHLPYQRGLMRTGMFALNCISNVT